LGARLAAVSYGERPTALRVGWWIRVSVGTARGVERGIVRAEKEGPLSHAEPSGVASLCPSPIDAALATRERDPTIITGGCEDGVRQTLVEVRRSDETGEAFSLADERRLTGDEYRGRSSGSLLVENVPEILSGILSLRRERIPFS
jgi:hypothetical protein